MRVTLASRLLAALVLLSAAVAQKRPLTHADYDDWKSVGAVETSLDGAWCAVVVSAQDGDGALEVYETAGERRWTHPRGRSPKFSADGRWLVFQIDPPKAVIRQ